MDAQRWQRLSPLLDALLELDPVERAERLRQLHGEDTETAAELESLIALEDAHGDFLSEPLVTPPGGARPGHKLGPYRLEKLLGEGGMGQVWLAARADGLYQRRVALKLLRPGLTDTNLRLRFTRERQILARLAHPHIARLLDAGVGAEGWPYLALEYVDGQPITDYCREHDTPLETRLRMFAQVCDAVSHAHANLIVHRDLKPSNILVTPAGDVCLLDFGIAKLLDSESQAGPMVEQTGTGVRAFTLHYAAPEQIRGEPVTTMTDVYSLGVVLYELLTDRKPYRLKRGSDAEWEEAILASDALRPSQAVLRAGEEDVDSDHAALRRRARLLAGDLDNIVLKTLSKQPEQRYPSVEALTLDLQRFEAGRPVLARPHSLGYRARKYMQRHRWALGTGALVTLVLTVALAIVAWQAREAVREAGRAQAMQDFMIGVFQNAGGARGQSLDLRELLATAVERGSRELARQPRARAELYGVVAQLRIELGDYHQAQALLERQARIIAATGQIPASLRLESLTQRGRVLRLLSRPRECIELMQPALADARRDQAQLPPQVTEFYSQLGRCRRANGEQRSARLLFERSLALRRETPNRVGEVENLMDLAGLHADTGSTRVALREFEDARTLLRREAGNRHPLLIDIRRNLGSLHRAHGEVARAESELRGALQISLEVNGPEHPVTWAVRRQLAALHIDLGRFAEAQSELREAHRRQAERLGADHPALAGSYRSLGLLAWSRGDLDAAQSALRQALTIHRAGDDRLLLARALSDLAAVLDASGQPQQARPLLLEALQLRRRALGPAHPAVGDVLRQFGEVELALGNTDAGERALQEAVRLTAAGYGPAHPGTRRAELALAYHDAAIGRAHALDRLDSLARLPVTDLELRQTAWRARAYAAQLRCDGPRREPALQELQALGEQLQQLQPEGGIVPREVAAITADCQEPPLPAAT